MSRSRGSTFAAALTLALLAAAGGDAPPRGDEPVAARTTFSPEWALASGQYWLHRDRLGDGSWLRAVEAVVGGACRPGA